MRRNPDHHRSESHAPPLPPVPGRLFGRFGAQRLAASSRFSDRRAALQSIAPSEAGVRGHAGVVSPRAIGLCFDSAVTESTSTLERAYRVRLRLKPAQERRLLRLFGTHGLRTVDGITSTS